MRFRLHLFVFHGSGVSLTQDIHTFDLFRSLGGVRSVKSAVVLQTKLHQTEAEDYVSASLVLGNGAPGDLMATTAMFSGFFESIEIIGSLGSARLSGANLAVHFLEGSPFSIRSEGGTGSGVNMMDFSHEPHPAVLTEFLDAIEENREPRVNGRDSLAKQQLIVE